MLSRFPLASLLLNARIRRQKALTDNRSVRDRIHGLREDSRLIAYIDMLIDDVVSGAWTSYADVPPEVK